VKLGYQTPVPFMNNHSRKNGDHAKRNDWRRMDCLGIADTILFGVSLRCRVQPETIQGTRVRTTFWLQSGLDPARASRDRNDGAESSVSWTEPVEITYSS
jgi:hypothetical protein